MNSRIRLISILIIFLSSILVVRLYFLQIVHGGTFSDKAERQYINQNTMLYDRGDIYFQSKNGDTVLAAISRSGYTIAINPKVMKDPKDVYKKLSEILVVDEKDFFEKASRKDKVNEEISKNVNTDTADKIRKLNLYGVTLANDKWRFYPGGKLASQTIGFVAYSGDKLAGRYGLERYYEDILRKDPSKAYNNFFAEFFGDVKATLSIGGEAQGSIITTIEPSTQLFLENELKKVRDTWGSDGAGGVIMDPMTGEIFALAWNPSFDPNTFKESNVEAFQNPIVEGVYEMGSIIKPIAMSAGLDSGAVKATTTYYDAGFLVLNNKRISNYDGKGRGTVDMQQVLNQSLNTGMAFVAKEMGNKDFSKYMKNFGLGTETGIDLPNEAHGLINNLDSTRDVEMATAAYGQGIALTPIATVRALSVLANGGKLVTPHLVKKIDFDSGLSKKISFAPPKQIIKEETSKEISRMLVGVVDKALRNGTAKIPGYSVAAKTGTAQMTEEGRAGYAEGQYLHSFFGYFPAYNPKFIVFLFHLKPKNVRYASETLTDPFLNITKFLINYYEIPPDRPEETISTNTVETL